MVQLEVRNSGSNTELKESESTTNATFARNQRNQNQQQQPQQLIWCKQMLKIRNPIRD